MLTRVCVDIWAIWCGPWITGRSAENLQKAASKIESPKLNTIVSDVSNLNGIAVLEKAIAESKIKIDVLFLNVGTAVFNSIEQVTETDFDA
ncbi:short-chain dehydrogenase/reductase SDR [Zunongwangia profunda]|uniref:Short-chain dehydrogenase/reductase SDR n=1 Tax=Zunongwangia profunda (strain DSM 18752 / CCTCC AB 206139 / SM-A87) TaxID=655815 RepID=D5BHV8_ZUNPS|nr:short-chain dehydrogenase/reductase SDR [Zunongwangia profunda]ADF51346.1 short-chain dehydrogenase/reductase SDR [Zunongwangia profunda SM-A87]|tara:strand:- start:401 stop:673 length:273 start_codon:yes stop_codon:yes gene_type:complete